MSFAGITTFRKNLNLVMESKAFKNSDDTGKLHIGGRLFFSKYGIGAYFGFGKVHELPKNEK